MPPTQATPDELNSLGTYLRSLPIAQAPAQRLREVAESAIKPVADPPVDPPAAAPLLAAAIDAGKSDRTLQPTPEIAAGRTLFVSHGCIACHGQSAEGTRLAPSLLGVSTRFPGDELPALLRRPTSKMRAGGMPAPAVNGIELAQLVTYLRSLAAPAMASASTEAGAKPRSTAAQLFEAKVSGVPVESALNRQLRFQDPIVAHGRELFGRRGCADCHGAEGTNGTVAAPGLAGTASLLPDLVLQKLLRHYSPRMLAGGMPPAKFSEVELAALVAYIRSLQSTAPEETLLNLTRTGTSK